MGSRIKKGSLLLEALLGVVILSTSITVVVQAMTQSLRAEVFSREATLASFYLDNVMTQIRAFPQNDQSLSVSQSSKYQVESNSDAREDVKVVNVTMSWASGQKKHSLLVSTYLPIQDAK